MKIDYINKLININKDSISQEDKTFIDSINFFIKKYKNYDIHLNNNMLNELKRILDKQEKNVSFKYNNSPNKKPYILSFTYFVMNKIRLKLKCEEYVKQIDFNLDESHKKFSWTAFDYKLAKDVNIIAYRGDSRSSLEIFSKGFKSLINAEGHSLFMENEFISGGSSVALTSDFKASSYFPISDDRETYIYICKVRRAYNTMGEHYKRFVLNNKNVSQDFLHSVKIQELNTDVIEASDVYAAFSISRIHFGEINYYQNSLPLPKGVKFKIRSIIYNYKNRSLKDNEEFLFVSNQLKSSEMSLINKEFDFSLA